MLVDENTTGGLDNAATVRGGVLGLALVKDDTLGHCRFYAALHGLWDIHRVTRGLGSQGLCMRHSTRSSFLPPQNRYCLCPDEFGARRTKLISFLPVQRTGSGSVRGLRQDT